MTGFWQCGADIILNVWRDRPLATIKHPYYRASPTTMDEFALRGHVHFTALISGTHWRGKNGIPCRAGRPEISRDYIAPKRRTWAEAPKRVGSFRVDVVAFLACMSTSRFFRKRAKTRPPSRSARPKCGYCSTKTCSSAYSSQTFSGWPIVVRPNRARSRGEPNPRTR